jgi:hypothetical protein
MAPSVQQTRSVPQQANKRERERETNTVLAGTGRDSNPGGFECISFFPQFFPSNFVPNNIPVFFQMFKLEMLWNVLFIVWNVHFLGLSGKKNQRPIVADLGEK